MITYKYFMKHAAKITKSVDTKERPVLGGIKHYEDGSAAVTDGHRLYLAVDIHDKGETLTSPAGSIVEGNYPDTRRLIPDSDPKQALLLNLKEITQAVDVLHIVAKNDELSLEGNSIAYKTEEVTAKVEVLGRDSFVEPILLNSTYLLEALQLFKDTGSSELSIKFYGSSRPVMLEAANVKSIILPVVRRH